MLNSHSNKALKNETKLCLEEFCLSCPGLLFCEEDFSWFLPIFAPLLLVSATASPQSLHSKHIFFSVCSAIHAGWFYNLLGFLVFIGSWEALWGAAAWHEVWHRLRAVIQCAFVPLKYVMTAFDSENPWGRSCRAAPRCEGSVPASLGSSLHHLWRDKSLTRIFCCCWLLGSLQSSFAVSVAWTVISNLRYQQVINHNL